MRKATLTLIIAAMLGTVGCAEPTCENAETVQANVPKAVNRYIGNGGMNCGATLVSSNLIITAEHCINDGTGQFVIEHEVADSVPTSYDAVHWEHVGPDTAIVWLDTHIDHIDPLPIGKWKKGTHTVVHERLHKRSQEWRATYDGWNAYNYYYESSNDVCVIPGSGGSPVIQDGKIVAVVSGMNWGPDGLEVTAGDRARFSPAIGAAEYITQ